MDTMESDVDDVLVVEHQGTESKSFKINEGEMRRLIKSDEAKKRTKKLFEKAMIREQNKKILKGHEILDCDTIELNDSNDFSHQSKLLRTGRVNQKSKTHASPMPSTSSVSEEDVHNIGLNTLKKAQAGVSSSEQEKERLLSKNSKFQGQKSSCRLCHKEFVDTALKDHLLSCMKDTYRHTVNDVQKENLKINSCCHICGTDISFMSTAERASHINACMDQRKDERKQKEEQDKQLRQAQSIILNCPVCQKKFRSALSRTKHLKKCALSNKMSVEQIKNLAKQQEEEHKKGLDAGIFPEDIKTSLLKNTKGKSKAKKRICEEDQDIQLAVALSTSLTEEREKMHASSLHSASSSKSSDLLLKLSKDQVEERISKRAAMLILNASPPEGSLSQTPAFKRRKQEHDYHQLNKFWNHTSLASPLKCTSSSTLQPEQEQSKQKPLTCTQYNISSVSRDVYYVPVLMPPVTVDNSSVGSKLRPVSTIPGRQRSMDGQGRQREEEVLVRGEFLNESNPGVDSTPQEEVQSQTVAVLAELAAENEDADSHYSDDLFDHSLISPDIEEDEIEVEVPSAIASQQLEVDSCELKKLSSSFLSLVNCSEHSDVQIAASQGELVPAHKVILFARCPQLYEICEDGLIDFSSYSKESVLSVLKYIYGGEISVMTDSIEDVMRICKSLCLPSLLEKVEQMWKAKEKPSSLKSPDSFRVEKRDEPTDEVSSVDQDDQNSNQSLKDLDENVSNSEFIEGDGDHVLVIRQPDYSMEQDMRNTNQYDMNPADADEMYSRDIDKQIKNLCEMSTQIVRENSCSSVANQVDGGQQNGINADDGQSQAGKIVCTTNPVVCGVSYNNPENLCITKSIADAKHEIFEKSIVNEDDSQKISSLELTIPEAELTKAHTIDDAMSQANEHSKMAVDPVQNADIQSAFQPKSGQEIFNEKQRLDMNPIFTPLPDSEMGQRLSDNQVPSHGNEIQNPLSVPVQECSNISTADTDGLNKLLLQTTSSVPFFTNNDKKSKSRSKKVSKKEFQYLVSKAGVGSLTHEDFEKITVKIEQDQSFLDKDVYIPSVLDDANPTDPNELQIIDVCICPQRFKSKIRANTKSLLYESPEIQGLTKQQRQICQNKKEMKAEIPVTKPSFASQHYLTDILLNPLQSLSSASAETPFSRQNNNVRKNVCTLESKVSTSFNSDVFLNSDDDLFDEIDEVKDKKLTTNGTGQAASISINSVMGSSVGCLTEPAGAEPERESSEWNRASLCKRYEWGKNIPLNPQVNGEDTQLQDAHFSTDSEKLQVELARAIAAEIQSVHSAEELSQSQDVTSDIEMCPIRQNFENVKSRLKTDFPPSTKPDYTESTPESVSREINQPSQQQQLPESITPIKKAHISDSPNLNRSVGSSGKKKTQRGLARLKNHIQTSQSGKSPIIPATTSNSPNFPATNSFVVKSLSASPYCGSRQEGGSSASGVHGDRNNTPYRSNEALVDDVISVSGKQLEECRRNLNFNEEKTNLSTKREINETVPSPSFGSHQILSSYTTLPSSTITKPSDRMSNNESFDPIGQTEAFMDGLVQCYTNIIAPHTSKSTSSTVSCSSHSSKLTSFNKTQASSQMTKPKENSCASHQATISVSSNSAQLSFISAHSENIMPAHNPSNSQGATTSMLLPSAARTPNAKCSQTENVDAASPPSFNKNVFMAYSPVIKKGKGALHSAMTDVSSRLASTNKIVNGNKCPLSSLLIDSVATAKDAASSELTTSSGIEERCTIMTAGGDISLNSVSLSEVREAFVPLKERLGIANRFSMKTKQLQSTSSQNVGQSDKKLPGSAEAGASASNPTAVNQLERLQSADKRTENQQISKSVTPRGQMISQAKKRCQEPSPFTPMPSYDEMNTPQLKKEVSKIGVRLMNKKRMKMLLKEVYRETHQYETDSDYEPTPVKQDCVDSSSSGAPPASFVCQSLAECAPSDNDVAGGEGSCSGPPTISSVTKLAPSASSLSDAKSDAEEGDDPLSSSQESCNSDVEDLAEESILQGWPEEEEMNPTQITQSSSETITERLLVFLRTNSDWYEKILMYEPLELDVLKKGLTNAGIRIGIAKLMDFLDEQCITFSMKNMSNRNNRLQKGRARTGKAS